MYNNEVTYHKRWETEENEEYVKKINKLLVGRHSCSVHVPLSWAKELYEMLVELDKDYGIAYCEKESLRLSEIIYSLVVTPLRLLLTGPRRPYFGEPLDPYVKVKRRIASVMSYYRRYLDRLWLSLKGKIYNSIWKPQIYVEQIKEKFGTLRFYVTALDSNLEFVIDRRVAKLEVDLAAKGAYFPLHDLYGWGTTRWDKSSPYRVQDEVDGQKITHYPYREHLVAHLGEEKYKKLREVQEEENFQDLALQREAVKKCILVTLDAEYKKAKTLKGEKLKESQEYCNKLNQYFRSEL